MCISTKKEVVLCVRTLNGSLICIKERYAVYYTVSYLLCEEDINKKEIHLADIFKRNY